MSESEPANLEKHYARLYNVKTIDSEASQISDIKAGDPGCFVINNIKGCF